MGLWPVTGPVCPVMLTTISRYGTGPWIAAAPFPTALATSLAQNEARIAPLVVPERITARKLFWLNGTAPSGNLDIGLYDEAFNRLVSSGSTAAGGASTIQEIDIADLVLGAGRYYLALVSDAVTSSVMQSGAATVGSTPEYGVAVQASAFPLPATLTPVVSTATRIPVLGIALRTLVA